MRTFRPWRGVSSPARMVAVAACLAVTLTACGTDDSSQSAETETGLVIGQSEPVQTFDPAMYRGRATQYVIHQIMDALVDLDENIEPTPTLAVEWEQTSDTVWTVKLREGVEFTNGEPFNADAVKYTYDRILDPATESPRVSLISTLDHVEVVDDYTVEFHTNVRDGAFMKALAYQEIVPPEYMEEVGSDEFAKAPIGTGPFKFVRHDPGQMVVMEANEEYWRGAPEVDTLTVRIIPETASRIAALKAGEVHIINRVPADLQDTLTGDVEPVAASGTEVFFLAMDVTDGPFADKAVRQAMQKAVNQQVLADTIFGGSAEPLKQPAFEAMNCYEDGYEGYEFNPDEANTVLADLPAVSIDVIEGEKTIAEAVAGQLKNAGLDVSVNAMEDGAHVARINAGDSDLYLAGWGAGRGTCDEIWRTHFHSSTRELQEFTGYTSPEIDDMLDSAAAALPDVEKANAIYHPLMHRLMEDSPWVPLVNPHQIYGVSNSVEGFVPSPIGRYDVTDVSIVK